MMFNNDQLDHMRSISALPDERVSWCGWGTIEDAKRGHCCGDHSCPGQTEGKTRADKLAVWCPRCRLTPGKDGTIAHPPWCKEPRT